MAKVNTNISIDPKLKENAVVLFSQFGLDLSTAISLFLQQSVREQRIPFEIRLEVPNKITREALDEMKDMKKKDGNYKRYENFAEIMKEV